MLQLNKLLTSLVYESWGWLSGLDHNSRIRVCSIQAVSRTSNYEICRRRIFSYESFHARKKKNQVPTSYLLQDLPLSFFCRSSQESEGFFYRRATFKGSWSTGSQGSRWVCQGRSVATKGRRKKENKENKKTKEGGLSPQEGDVRKTRKEEKKKTKEGKKVAPAKARFRVPSTKNFFFGSRVFGFWETHLD